MMVMMVMVADGWNYANACSRVVVVVMMVMTHANYNLSDFQILRPRC
jgi:hypothetical protein